MAVEPTFIAMNMVISKNLGWVVRPTAVSAQGPSWPTIIKSTIEASWVSVSSTSEGQAMWTISAYSIREVTPSGRCLVTFRSAARLASSVPGLHQVQRQGLHLHLFAVLFPCKCLVCIL